jgi:putative membrane protein
MEFTGASRLSATWETTTTDGGGTFAPHSSGAAGGPSAPLFSFASRATLVPLAGLALDCPREARHMKLIYIALIVLVTVAMLLFKFPSVDMVTLTFLSMTTSLPLPTVLIIVYVMGMVTGGALLALLRSIIRRTAPKRY